MSHIWNLRGCATENVGKTSLVRALKSTLSMASKRRKQTISSFGTLTKATTALLLGKKKEGEEEGVQVSGDTLSTDGIDLTVEALPLSEVAMNLSSSKEKARPKVPLSFSVWDFGGTLALECEFETFWPPHCCL